MASDLDEELLAAAGCTGKGRSRPFNRRMKEGSQDSEESAQEEEEEEEEEELEEVEEDDDDSDVPSRKRKVSAVQSPRQKGGFPDDEENDEAEDSLSELSFGEDLYKDDEDRARLNAMHEVDREMILYERGDKFQEHKRRELQKARKRAEKARRTRVPVTPPSTRRRDMASTPTSGRSRVLPGRKEKAEILSNLVALKQSKSRDSALKKRRLAALSSDEDEEEDSSGSRNPHEIPTLEDEEEAVSHDVSTDDGRFAATQKKGMREEPTFQDFAEITIRRSKLAKWLSEPYFEGTVVGCFVRLAVGEDSSTGYHLCQVTGIEDGNPSRMYKLENRTTVKYMTCAFGNKVFTTSMSRVSEQPPNQTEFDEWREVVEEDLSVYSDLVAKKAAAIIEVGAYVYSADAVKLMIEEKKKSAGRPFNLAAEKDRVSRELALAQHEHPSDMAKIGQLQAQLRQLEVLAAQRRVKDAKAIALAEMNRRNREENFRNASQRKAHNAGRDAHDPFSRRWTRSQNYYSKTPAQQPKVDPVAAPIVNVVDQAAQKEAAEAGKLVNTAPPLDQLVQLHRFDLPIDLTRLQKFGSGPAAADIAYLSNRQRIESIYGPPVEVHNPLIHPQTLSINDYKRRMNLID